MHAILSGGALNGTKIKGGKLFVTTYPCHACARHIVAAGISEVYYIEPYRKSLATKLHGDAITESAENNEHLVKILPYEGVAPSKYMKLFKVKENSRKTAGVMVKVKSSSASPRVEKSLEAVPTLEALVTKNLAAKQIVKA
jgi:deoxycytidylate deaminase